MSKDKQSVEEELAKESQENQTEEPTPEVDEDAIEEVSEELNDEPEEKSEVDELKDQLLRVQAEMVNVRRRSEEEVSKARKFAVEGFAKELLSSRDSLQLAAATELEAEDSDAVKSMHEGLEITLKQLDAAFDKFSIEEVAPEAGEKLDPNLHQAMTMIPSEDVEPGAIVSTIQKGYTLNGRLLRPAMVVVAQK